MSSRIAWAALAVMLAPLGAQETSGLKAGPQPGGAYLLPTGWSLRPAGIQMQLGPMPMASEVSPDGKFLLLLEGGEHEAAVRSISLETQREVAHLALPAAWLGMRFAPGKPQLYVSGGASGDVYEVNVSPEGALARARTFRARAPEEKGPVVLGDIAFPPGGRLLYVADVAGNRVLVINPQSGRVIYRFASGRRPYRILFHPDGKSYFLTSWTDGTLYHYETDTGNRLGFLRLGPHTTDMVWRGRETAPEEGEEFPYRARIFVAASNTNRVYSVGVTGDNEMRLLEAIDVALSRSQPLGATPSALALNADESRLFIACSEMNAVAVADVSTAKSRVLGFVPSGRYPNAVRVVAGGRLVVLNLGVSGRGSASWIDRFDEAGLSVYTETVIQNMPVNDGEPAGRPSPIQHVVYIVKGNLSYDEVLGDLAGGSGDASLVRFPASITPNHHKLAREFVLFDNFYAIASTPIEGAFWNTAAIVPDFIERTGGSLLPLPEATAVPPTGYLWNQAVMAAIPFRNYGFFVTNLSPARDGAQVEKPKQPALDVNTSLRYRGPDAAYPDTDRARAFLEDFTQLEQQNSLPRLMMVSLGGDRAQAGAAAVADNDRALGLIVEGVSHSKSWANTAIFVVEGDAEGAVDHVYPHRTPAYVLSPYTRRGGAVDSGFYNTASVMRAIESILGLKPMTHYDAAAQPLPAAFAASADPSPYSAEKPAAP